MINPKKIIIGTAQFGSAYGISNSSGILKHEEIKKIFKITNQNNITFFDTSTGYGTSEEIIGRYNKFELNVVTKLSKIPEIENTQICEWIFDQVTNSIKKLNSNKLYGLLLHYPEQLFSKNGMYIYDALIQLKRQSMVKKIGISLYSIEQLSKFITEFELDLVQAPLNIIDQRLVTENVLSTLKHNNIELHARSIFLQGLLLMDRNKIPKYFDRWSKLFEDWHKWLKANKLSAVEACLSFVNNLPNIDKIIIGVNNHIQLLEIMNLKIIKKMNFPAISSNDNDLINPSNWRY